MAVVYRYTDLDDNIIKYVGIVWSGNRTLQQRDNEHRKNDDWCKNRQWKVEYLNKTVLSRTDAEALEAHYISKFETDKFFNVRKAGWGISELIDDSKDEWALYSTDEENISELTKTYSIDEACINKTKWGTSLEIATKDYIFNFYWSVYGGYSQDLYLPDGTPTEWKIQVSSFRETIYESFIDEDGDINIPKDIASFIQENSSVQCQISEITGEPIKVIINTKGTTETLGFFVKKSCEDSNENRYHQVAMSIEKITYEDENDFNFIRTMIFKLDDCIDFLKKSELLEIENTAADKDTDNKVLLIQSLLKKITPGSDDFQQIISADTKTLSALAKKYNIDAA